VFGIATSTQQRKRQRELRKIRRQAEEQMAINYLQRKGDTKRFLSSWTSVTEKAAIKRYELDKAMEDKQGATIDHTQDIVYSIPQEPNEKSHAGKHDFHR